MLYADVRNRGEGGGGVSHMRTKVDKGGGGGGKEAYICGCPLWTTPNHTKI